MIGGRLYFIEQVQFDPKFYRQTVSYYISKDATKIQKKYYSIINSILETHITHISAKTEAMITATIRKRP